ncbi:MAG: hypothetical protein JWO64_1269 [Hyphomicrobiales bacterium]|jgi:uncharacterized membrane protein YuzA (DUF378 family)|nr:hypothetical protein [Hyphomicrobiales bacterium]
MKALNLLTLFLIIVGGINWGLFGAANIDLVATIFGGPNTTLAKIVYILVGLSAVYQLLPFARAASIDEVPAEAGLRPNR